MESNNSKGKFFLKFATRALLLGLREIPGVGMALDLVEEWQDVSHQLRQEQEDLDQEERLARIEAALALTPGEARQIAAEVIAEERAGGVEIATDREAAVLDIAAAMPAVIRERTQATLRAARQQGTAPATVLPIGATFSVAEQDAFYLSLFPTRRPRFQADDRQPGANPEWRLTELIGAGGFGEVWLARHRLLGDRRAVKFCQNETGAKLLRREAETLYALRRDLPKHPNIVSLLDLQLSEEPYWLAFEYVDGGTLESRMRVSALTWDEAMALFVPLVRGMAAVHDTGIVHRDLKPANILLDPQPKITDFGIGKIISAEKQTQRDTRFTTLGYGSAGYMSPEQEDGEPAHPADDVYALAVILWQMLSGDLKRAPRYPGQIHRLEISATAKELLIGCIFSPRHLRFQNAGALLAYLSLDEKVTFISKEEKRDIKDHITQERTSPPLEKGGQGGFSKGGVLENPPQSPFFKGGGPPPQSPFPTEADEFSDPLPDGFYGPAMQVVRPGRFRMGDSKKRYRHGAPTHEVIVGYAFALGKYPVTVGEFRRFIQDTGYRTCAETGIGGHGAYIARKGKQGKDRHDHAYWDRPYFPQDDTHPVTVVAWRDAAAYCEWLSARSGRPYRLPSEAEWEYTCRAGGHGDWCFGDDSTQLDAYAWYDENAGGGSHPVGEKRANAWGFYDMHGNVQEWVADRVESISDSYYPPDYIRRHPLPVACGEHRVSRGGDWFHEGKETRAACRQKYYWGSGAYNRDNTGGFRVACDLADEVKPALPSTPPPEPLPAEVQANVFQDPLQDGGNGPALVKLPTGRFLMGKATDKAKSSTAPVHEVTIDLPFALGQFPVTVGEFRRFVQATGYRTNAETAAGGYVLYQGNVEKHPDAGWDNPYFPHSERHPAVLLVWDDAGAYCQWLSEQTGHTYRLPAEAEWEYACRADTTTDWSFGDDPASLDWYAWHGGNAEGGAHAVGEKHPNPWGLYDMHGNVSEWVADKVGHAADGYTPAHIERHPAPMETGKLNLLRGGDWLHGAGLTRSASRQDSYGKRAMACVGFRVLRELPADEAVGSLSRSEALPDLALEPDKTRMLEIDKTFHGFITKSGGFALLGGIAMHIHTADFGYAIGFFLAAFFLLSSLAELLYAGWHAAKFTRTAGELNYLDQTRLYRFYEESTWKSTEAKRFLAGTLATAIADSAGELNAKACAMAARKLFSAEDLHSNRFFSQFTIIFIGGSTLLYQATVLTGIDAIMSLSLPLLFICTGLGLILAKRRQTRLERALASLTEKLGDAEKRDLLAFIGGQEWKRKSNPLRFRKMIIGKSGM